MTDRERLIQAFRNVAESFGGATRTLLIAIINEEKRLKRWEESQITKEMNKRHADAEKERKATGEWPEWYRNSNDFIPF